MNDFTISCYQSLIQKILSKDFNIQTVAQYLETPARKTLILRHDVDRLPQNSLVTAKLEYGLKIKGTYYFRLVRESFNREIIARIADMGHEVGYHYEDMSFAWEKHRAQGTGRRAQAEELERKVVDIGIESFKENLEKLRKIAPVKTICMHGSPLSRWDSRLMWKYYDYHDFGIIGEPYFDIDFNRVLYLTDTGRRWDGEQVSLRDKVNEGGEGESGRRGEMEKGRVGDGERIKRYKDWKVKPVKYRSSGSHNNLPLTPSPPHPLFQSYHSTSDIIKAAGEGRLPDKIMMTFHPQRWSDKPIPWLKELVWQNVKNTGKYLIVRCQA